MPDSSLGQSGVSLTRGGYWTGPVLGGVQHGWRCEWASGPFGKPSFYGYGNDAKEASADLARKIKEADRA